MAPRNPTLTSRGMLWSVPLLLAVPLAAQDSTGSVASDQPFPEAALPVQWADFDGDGLDDALVLTTEGRLTLLQAQVGGTFLDVTEQAGLEALTNVRVSIFQDYDHDGRADVFAGGADGRVHLMQNLGGTFRDVTSGSGIAPEGAVRSAHWMDYDGDDLLDLHLVSARANTLYHGQADGTFEPVELPVPGSVGSSGTVATRIDDLGHAADLDEAPGASADDAGSGSDGRREDDRSGRGGAAGSGGTNPGAAPPSVGIVHGISLNCVASMRDANGGPCISASSTATLGMLYPLSETFFVDEATGKVGIGTTTPSETVEIIEIGFKAGLQITELVSGRGAALFLKNPARTWRIISDSDPDELRIQDGDVERLSISGTSGNAAFANSLTVGYRLGVNTDSPVTDLHVNGAGRFEEYLNVVGVLTVEGETRLLGRVGIGTISPATALDVNGAITIRGGADIVETFESSCGTLEPGTVVVIDPNSSGALMCSSAAYDTKVAGVVSGAGGVKPGLLLGQDDMFSGDTMVAMTGRVYVNCSTENGPIVPGDRLTTASLKGHAMRVSEERPSSGCVIGKAMSSLESGSGLVLVLVNLQ